MLINPRREKKRPFLYLNLALSNAIRYSVFIFYTTHCVGLRNNMPEILNIPPSIPKEKVDTNGSKFVVSKAEKKDNVQTSQGKISHALTIEGHLANDKDLYSYLFSIDKDQIAGSVGRILSRFGFSNTDDLTPANLTKKLVGQELTIKRRNDKLYWY